MRKLTLKPKRYPAWYGIRGIQFIWQGEWNDPLLKRRSRVINACMLEDLLWSMFREDIEEKRTTLDESEFDVWMQDPEHQRIAVEEFDNLISAGYARWVKPVYDLAFVEV